MSSYRQFSHSKDWLSSTTILLLALSLLAPIISTMHAANAAAATSNSPSIRLNPTQGFSFSTVHFNLTGFHPRHYFGIDFDTTSKAGGPYHVTPAWWSLDASGGYYGSFGVLGAAHGKPVTVTVLASDQPTYPWETSYNATTYFTILPPSITLNPTSGVVGTNVSITGHGFSPGGSVMVGGTTALFSGWFTADSHWNIKGYLQVVEGASAGLHTVEARDTSSGSYGTALFTVIATRITSFTISPNPFSPNGDGVKDTTTIRATINVPITWMVQIKTLTGAIIRIWSGTGSTLTLVWNGKNTAGVRVADGIYNVALSRVSGTPYFSMTKQVKVDTKPPTVTLVSVVPASFNPRIGQTTRISYTLSEPCYVTLKVYNSAGTLVRTLLNSASQGAGAHSVVWNGKNSGGTIVPRGKYTVKIWVTDKAGNKASPYPIVKTVTIV